LSNIIFKFYIYLLLTTKKYEHFDRQQRLIGTNIVILIVSYSPYGVFFMNENLHISVCPYAQKVAMIFCSYIIGLNRAVRNSCFMISNRARCI
jgi:hypothetical protein